MDKDGFQIVHSKKSPRTPAGAVVAITNKFEALSKGNEGMEQRHTEMEKGETSRDVDKGLATPSQHG